MVPALSAQEMVAIDGKTSRRSGKLDASALHRVSAFAAGAKLVPGQTAAAATSSVLHKIRAIALVGFRARLRFWARSGRGHARRSCRASIRFVFQPHLDELVCARSAARWRCSDPVNPLLDPTGPQAIWDGRPSNSLRESAAAFAFPYPFLRQARRPISEVPRHAVNRDRNPPTRGALRSAVGFDRLARINGTLL